MANRQMMHKSLIEIIDDLDFVCEGLELIMMVHDALEQSGGSTGRAYLRSKKKVLARRLEALRRNKVEPLKKLFETSSQTTH